METSKQNIIIIGILLLFIILYSINTHTFYHRTQIVVDTKIQTKDTYQLYYDTGNGFNEAESTKIDVDPTTDFESIVFDLPFPATNIIGFRIDTGSDTKELDIREISVQTKKEAFSWGAQEILTEFTEYKDFSLIEARGGILHLETAGNDPQFVHKGNIFDKVEITDHSKNWKYSIISIVLAFGIFVPLAYIKKSQKLGSILREYKYFILFFFIAFATYSLWLAAFFPGTMSFDSISQWKQTIAGIYDNAHPFVHSILISFLRSLWDSPAVVSLFQIFTSSFIIAYSLHFFLTRGVSKIKVFVIFAIFLIFPSIGIYNVTLWKDVFFAQLITLLSVMFVSHYTNQEKINNYDIALVSFITVLIANIRHNGIVYFLLIPTLYALCKILNIKKMIVLLSFIVVFYVFFSVILFNVLNVTEKSARLPQEFIRLQILGNSLQGGYIPTDREAQTIEKVLSLTEFRQRYNCAAIDYLRINNSPINVSVFMDDIFFSEFNKTTNTIIQRNLLSAFNDRICLFSTLIGIKNQNLQYLYHWNIDQNMHGLKQSPNEVLHNFFTSYIEWSTKSPQRWILWSHITYILIYIWFFIRALYKKNYTLFGFIILIGINIPVLFVFGIARDFRYLYMIQFALPLLFLVDALHVKPQRLLTEHVD